MRNRQYPLYHEELEHESCGVGAIVDLSGKSTHRTVDQALSIVERLAHRAGSDALGTTGDGVGILTQLPHAPVQRGPANHWPSAPWPTAAPPRGKWTGG